MVALAYVMSFAPKRGLLRLLPRDLCIFQCLSHLMPPILYSLWEVLGPRLVQLTSMSLFDKECGSQEVGPGRGEAGLGRVSLGVPLCERI